MQARNAASGDPMLAAVDDKAVAAPVGTSFMAWMGTEQNALTWPKAASLVSGRC